MLQQLLSACQMMYNQVDQIEDVKICKENNVETRYYKVKWKCTWEPEPILKKICSSAITKYNDSLQCDKKEITEISDHNSETSNIENGNLENTAMITSKDFIEQEISDDFTSLRTNDLLENKKNIQQCLVSNIASHKENDFNLVADSNESLLSQNFHCINNLDPYTDIKPDKEVGVSPNFNIFNISNLSEQNDAAADHSLEVVNKQNKNQYEQAFEEKLTCQPIRLENYIQNNVETHDTHTSQDTRDTQFQQGSKSTLNINDLICESLDIGKEITEKELIDHQQKIPTQLDKTMANVRVLLTDVRTSNIENNHIKGKSKSVNAIKKSYALRSAKQKNRKRMKKIAEKLFKCKMYSFSTTQQSYLKLLMRRRTGEIRFKKHSKTSSFRKVCSKVSHHNNSTLNKNIMDVENTQETSEKGKSSGPHVINTGEDTSQADVIKVNDGGVMSSIEDNRSKKSLVCFSKEFNCETYSSLSNDTVKNTKIHHGYNCDKCPYVTVEEKEFKWHSPKHRNCKRFNCHQCEYATSRKISLERHMHIHKIVKQNIKQPVKNKFKCQICSYSTQYKNDLTKHQGKHKVEKTFNCNYCPYATVRNFELKQHLATHVGVKPSKCDKCFFTTFEKEGLKLHIAKHRAVKPF